MGCSGKLPTLLRAWTLPGWAALPGRDAGACSLCHSLQRVPWGGCNPAGCISSRDSSGCLEQDFGCLSFPSCPNSCKPVAAGLSTRACQVKG